MADDGIPDGFAPANFSPGFLEAAGPYWLKPLEGATVVGLAVGEQHNNYLDMAHGGVLTTLADVALSFQVHNSERPQLNVATNALTCNFLAPARVGDWLEAHAKIDRIGKRIAYASGDIRRGGEVLMTMSGVFTVFR